MRLFILFFISFILYMDCIAQINTDLIIEQLDKMAENGDEEYNDYSELIEAYWNITENPIDINSDDIDQLTEFGFISIFQLGNIKKYRKDFSDFQFIEELYMVEGLDSTSIETIRPLVCIKKNNNDKIMLRDIYKYGKNKILIEVNQCLNKKEGYSDIDDSLLYQKPNSVYLGSQQRIYLRYNYSFRDKIEAGLVLEKDPGEYLLKRNINDSIRRLLGDRCYPAFDFFSFHIHLKNIAFIKSLAIGDYKLSFGQGLTMGSGMTFSSEGGNMLRRNKKIVASKSANESYYLRGIASTLKYNNIELSIFYSSKKSDANITSYDSSNETALKISSLQHSGLHRTYNEMMDRDAVRQQLYGMNISYQNSYLQIGYTLHKTSLNLELAPEPKTYNLFYFEGKELVNQGVDFHYITNKTILYGEVAMSDNRKLAGLMGVCLQPTGYIDLNILYRNYAKDYQCLYGNAFSSGSSARDEEGWYFSINTSIASNWRFVTYIDLHKSKWIKNNTYAPSEGHNFDSKISYQTNNNFSLFLEYRNKNKMRNTTDKETYQKYIVNDKKNMIRFHLNYEISRNIILRNRIEYHFNKSEQEKYKSYLIYQDVAFNPEDKPYNISFRYELFDSEKGSVYSYENDILYSFGINGLNGKGIRTYLVGKLKLMNQIQISGKIGFTFYDGKEEIGSGLETIHNNWKGDAKLQLIWSF